MGSRIASDKFQTSKVATGSMMIATEKPTTSIQKTAGVRANKPTNSVPAKVRSLRAIKAKRFARRKRRSRKFVTAKTTTATAKPTKDCAMTVMCARPTCATPTAHANTFRSPALPATTAMSAPRSINARKASVLVRQRSTAKTVMRVQKMCAIL